MFLPEQLLKQVSITSYFGRSLSESSSTKDRMVVESSQEIEEIAPSGKGVKEKKKKAPKRKKKDSDSEYEVDTEEEEELEEEYESDHMHEVDESETESLKKGKTRKKSQAAKKKTELDEPGSVVDLCGEEKKDGSGGKVVYTKLANEYKCGKDAKKMYSN